MTVEIVKIVFPLVIDEDGFPPISSETMNALQREDGFVLENTPFFASGVALGDLVHGIPMSGQPKHYEYGGVLASSQNKALSIIFLDMDIKDSVLRELEQRGCYCEYGEFGRQGALQMLAVAVPLDCEYQTIVQYLARLENDDLLSYAELAV